MKLEDKLRSGVAARIFQPPPITLQGVTKERIAEVLQAIDRASRDQIDTVFGDSMPDILLWNQKTDTLWVIEAVTSDGEVDLHKVQSLTSLAKRAGKKSIGFTTAYATWRDAAARQRKHKNIAPNTYIWIREDGAKQFSVETFQSTHQRLHQ